MPRKSRKKSRRNSKSPRRSGSRSPKAPGRRSAGNARKTQRSLKSTYDDADVRLARPSYYQARRHKPMSPKRRPSSKYRSAQGLTHFKLFLIEDSVLKKEGVREGGNCFLYAVFLGYLAVWPTETEFETFDKFVRALLDSVKTTSDWRKQKAEEYLEGVLLNDANIIMYKFVPQYLYGIMATLLKCTIQLKRVNDVVGKVTPHSFNEEGEKSIYLTTNKAHVSLYLQSIPAAATWHAAFHHMWTDPPQFEMQPPFRPVLSNETWADVAQIVN